VLAIDTRGCHIMMTVPHRHGVASMLAALIDAGIQVIQIEPRGGERGTYHLIVSDRPRLAVNILEGIGCQALGSSDDAIGGPLTRPTDRYTMRESRLPH
jgi:hypothetical protein